MFVPLTSELIDEGEFHEAFEKAFRDAQKLITEHRSEFEDAAHKATVKVVAEVSITIMDAKEGMTQLKWDVNVKPPKRPGGASVAMESVDQLGKPALFVKAGGSDSGDPRQMKFSTADGRNVDNESGDVDSR